MGPDRIPADWPLRDCSEFIHCGEIVWHTQRIGAGPVVLLLHGTGASSHSMAGLATLLSRQFTCVLIDLPGQGFTSALRERKHLLSAMSSAVADLCDQLNLVPDYVIGHSAGAAVGIRMSLDTPVAPKGILSINGALLPFGAFIEPLMIKAARGLSQSSRVVHFLARRGTGKAYVRRALRDTGAAISEPMIKRYSQLISQPEHIEGTLRMMGGWELGKLAADLAHVTTPVHLIGSAKDHIVPATRAHRATRDIPGSTAVTLGDAGHLIHEADPQRIFDEFIHFLERLN
ncbi:alpha/beta fold hydrolase [Luminiphilus sp.]|nr:alpha/beta fold hydrolase [Luminiphilus sp.]MDB2316057.1 alpha/beta fold hydrolase [Luminiphilus sp.]MDB2379634.1 alpha/beta fold hydrolase [Luminiphilus sp.]MDB2692519.1 alpha/beta fold hydrolase [Luminiphilus sp.]